MKTALTLTLTASLIATSLPAAAQTPYMPPPRYTPPPRYMQPPATYSSDWMRVRAIAPGSRIRVAAIGLGDQDHQYFVSASDSTLTMLLVGSLPRSARRLAVKLAVELPQFYMLPEKWMEFSDGRVRATSDGLFVGGHKVADLSDFARTIDAGEVFEVARPLRDRPPAAPVNTPDAQAAAVAIPLTVLILASGQRLKAAATLGVLFGVPIAAGMLFHKLAEGRGPVEVVYRAR